MLEDEKKRRKMVLGKTVFWVGVVIVLVIACLDSVVKFEDLFRLRMMVTSATVMVAGIGIMVASLPLKH